MTAAGDGDFMRRFALL